MPHLLRLLPAVCHRARWAAAGWLLLLACGEDLGAFGPGVVCRADLPCRAPLVCIAGHCEIPAGARSDAGDDGPAVASGADASAPADLMAEPDSPQTRGTGDGPGDALGSSDSPAETCTPGRAAFCGRSADGIVCAFAEPSGAWGPARLVAPAFGDAAGWQLTPARYATIQFPDVSGDGVADVCGRGDKGIVCALGERRGGFGPATLWSAELADAAGGAGWQTSASRWATIRFPDLNGDRRADICGQAEAGHWCALSTGRGFASGALWGSSLGGLGPTAARPTVWGTVQYADLDDDRRDDFCVRGPAGVHCALSSGLGFGFLQLWSTGFADVFGGEEPTVWPTVQIADATGDGLADLCGRGFYQLVCLLGRGGLREQPEMMPRFFNEARIAEFGDELGFAQGVAYYGSIQLADLDGDGRLDVCGKAPDGLWCARSTGFAGSVPATRWTDSVRDDQGWAPPLHALSLQLADLDGDGKEDLCGRRAEGLACSLSNGKDGFVAGPSLAAFRDADGFAPVSSASTVWYGTFAAGTCHPDRPTRAPRRALSIAVASGIISPD